MMKKLLGIWLLAASVYGVPVEVIEQDILTGSVQKKIIEDKSFDKKPVLNESLTESVKVLSERDIRIIRVADRIQFVILTRSIFDDSSKEMTKKGLSVANAIGDILKSGAQAVKVVSLASTNMDAKRVDNQAKSLMSAVGTVKTPLIYYSSHKGLDRNTLLPFWADEDNLLDFEFLDAWFDESPMNNIIVIQAQLNAGQKF